MFKSLKDFDMYSCNRQKNENIISIEKCTIEYNMH